MDDDFSAEIGNDFGKLSKINSAALVNSTLSNLWLDFFRHFRAGKYLAANSDMDCIWTILGGEKDIEKNDIETNYLSIEEGLRKSGTLRDSIEVAGFGEVDEAQLIKIAKQKDILLKKSIFLRRLQNSQGKGTAYHDGDDEELD